MNCEHSKMDNLPFHCQRHCVECGMSESEIKLSEIIKQLQAEVESLKNCANCRHIIWGDGELLCSKNWVGNKMDKCKHWQKAGD